MEGLGGRQEREGASCREEEICGEIIIPGVTVATFCEVDVNKILSYTIHFNFTSKRCCRKRGSGWVGRRRCTYARPRTNTFAAQPTARRRWPATCAAYRPAARKHIIACSHLTCQNSRDPCLLIFGFSGFELLEIK